MCVITVLDLFEDQGLNDKYTMWCYIFIEKKEMTPTVSWPSHTGWDIHFQAHLTT